MKSIRDEQGNAILESVSFAAVAFGLVLTSGLALFQMQEDQLELQILTRNVMRELSLHPEVSVNDALQKWKSFSPSWKGRDVLVEFTCHSPCWPGSVEWLRLSGSGLQASGFGISDG